MKSGVLKEIQAKSIRFEPAAPEQEGVVRTTRVLDVLEKMTGDRGNAKRVRGYLLTGDSSFRESFSGVERLLYFQGYLAVLLGNEPQTRAVEPNSRTDAR